VLWWLDEKDGQLADAMVDAAVLNDVKTIYKNEDDDSRYNDDDNDMMKVTMVRDVCG